MELSYAGLCSYRDGNGRLSRCNLHVYRDGDAAVVVATEREDNPGASITNTYGHLATGLIKKLKLSVEQTTWVEHYCDSSYGFPIAERIDWVKLVQNGNDLVSPEWTPGSREALEHLIGQAFEEGRCIGDFNGN